MYNVRAPLQVDSSMYTLRSCYLAYPPLQVGYGKTAITIALIDATPREPRPPPPPLAENGFVPLKAPRSVLILLITDSTYH